MSTATQIQSRQTEVEQASDRIVCRCLQVSELEIREAIADNRVQAVLDVVRCTGAGTGCTACLRSIREILLARQS